MLQFAKNYNFLQAFLKYAKLNIFIALNAIQWPNLLMALNEKDHKKARIENLPEGNNQISYIFQTFVQPNESPSRIGLYYQLFPLLV